VTKDLVKEALHDALHVPGPGGLDRARSRRLSGAAMDLLWTLAARAGPPPARQVRHTKSRFPTAPANVETPQ
jgi:hypothetical protein